MLNFNHLNNEEAFKRHLANLQITEEQYETLDTRIHVAKREEFAGINLVPIVQEPDGIGFQVLKDYTLTEMADGIIAMDFVPDEDTIDKTPNTQDVPIMQQSYLLTARDLASSNGNLRSPVLDSALYKLAETQDKYLIDGWYMDGGTTPYQNGLYNAAGNNTAGADFGTATQVVTTLNTAFSTLATTGNFFSTGFNLTLNPVQYNELMALFTNTGIPVVNWVMTRLQGGKIYQSNAITAGTGMLTAAGDHSFFEYHISVDRGHWEYVRPETQDVWGKIYIVSTLRVIDDNAIMTLTGI